MFFNVPGWVVGAHGAPASGVLACAPGALALLLAAAVLAGAVALALATAADRGRPLDVARRRRHGAEIRRSANRLRRVGGASLVGPAG
jgi:hypothetical protein